MKWVVQLGDEFQSEYDFLPEEVQDELLATIRLLQQFGPQLKRPHVDTLNGSKYANLKELRSTLRMAFGGQPLPSTRIVRRWCSPQETNQASAKGDFTVN